MGSLSHKFVVLGGALLIMAGTPGRAFGHCDAMDGPVVKAARRALESGNVNYVLLWVQPEDETSIRSAFQRARKVRAQGSMARDIADLWFYETLVRVHREGEGAPYTGLKPAGPAEHAAIKAADQALANGSLVELESLLAHAVRDGLRERFEAAMVHRQFEVDDLTAGRAYVRSYVPLIHYVEAIYDLARGSTAQEAAAGGHQP